MSRATIDYGIDLGTTNSAIAVLKGVSTEIIKNNVDHDITPSAVSIDKKGEVQVGQRAKNRIIDWPKDAYMEFKRRMGSNYVYHFKSSSQQRRPENLSAEVLKELRANVQQRIDEILDAAVVTVPAVFELHQCDATKKAAQLAGFKQSALLQEPVAAALAFGFQANSAKAYWLVYDFGGGTFDAAVIKAEEGTIHVVDHDGDNFLGGSDIDWALVEKVVVPRILEEHDLENFNRANAGIDKRWYRAFMRLKFAVEQAKIELSRKDVATLDPDHAKNLVDDSTGEVVIEELDLQITKRELIRIAEPFILRSTEIAKRVLKKKGLSPSAIERVILVGGPTLAPYFREILAAELCIPLDHSMDPLTVVARGAAVFAGTQRLEIGGVIAAPAGEFVVDLKYKPVGLDSAPMVGGKVSGCKISDFTGFSIEFVNEKTQWRGGKIPLRADGVFMADLHAERGDRNTFLIELFDATGRKRKTNPDRLIYSIGAVVDEQPLINSMGVALANNEYAKYFEKGRGLPLKKTGVFRTVHAVRQGQSGEVLKIPVVEGERELADRNRLNGVLEIWGHQIRRDLPVGSEVEVALQIDESRIITVKAYVPLLDEEFEAKIEMRRQDPTPEQLAADYETEMKRLQELKSKATVAGGDTAKAVIGEVEKNLVQELKDALSAAKGDLGAAAKCEKRLLELKVRLDEAADALEWPALVTEVRQWLGYLETLIKRCEVTEAQEEKAAQLKDEIEEIIAQTKIDRLRKKRDQVERLYWEIAFTQDGFWVDCFKRLERDKQRISDRVRGDRLLDQGRQCIQANNINGLRNVVTQLWDLLPRDVVEAAQRGYQSGLIR